MPPANKADSKAVAMEWLRDAQSDFALSTVPKTRRIRYAHLCFHAQQAAEKSVKAIFIHLGNTVPKTHDLAFLMDSLPKSVTPPLPVLDLPTLTRYAVQHRYPGQDLPLSRRDYTKAVALAKVAIQWANRVIVQSKTFI